MKEVTLQIWVTPSHSQSCLWEESSQVPVLSPSCQHLHKDARICHVPLKDGSPHLCLSGHQSTLSPPGDAENIHTEGDCRRGLSLNKRPSSAKQQQHPPGSVSFLKGAGVSPVALGGISPFQDPFDG